MQWIEANNCSFRVNVTGEGEPLVLLHELGGCIESWDEVVPALTKKFRILRYDMRGFGMSERMNEITMDGVLDDLAAVLDAVGWAGPSHFAGSAIGGGFAAAFAARNPQRVKSLFLPSPSTDIPATGQGTFLARIQVVAEQGMRVSVEGTMGKAYPVELRGDGRVFDQYRRRWLANDPQSFIALCRVAAAVDMRTELPQIRCPTTVVGCTLDAIRPPAMTRGVADAIPDARFIEAESGHFMHLQAPEAFVRELVAFTASLHA